MKKNIDISKFFIDKSFTKKFSYTDAQKTFHSKKHSCTDPSMQDFLPRTC